MPRRLALLACLVVLGSVLLSLGGCGNSALEQGLRAERAGNDQDAFAAYSAAIASTFMVGNKRAQAYAGRAGIYTQQGKLDLALSDLGRALQQDAQCEAAYYNRAVAYLLQGKPSLALGDATRLVELAPRNPAARRLYDLAKSPPAKFTLPLTWLKANKG